MCLSPRFYTIKAFFINVISLLTHPNTSLRAQPLEVGASQAPQKKVFSHGMGSQRGQGLFPVAVVWIICRNGKIQQKTTPVTVHLDHSLVFMWDGESAVVSLQSQSCIGDVIKGNRNLRGVEMINATKLLLVHVKPASRRRTAGAHA